MSIETVRIIPEKINPEWLGELYYKLTDEGKVALDEFLSAQDLEVDLDGNVVKSPIRYHLIPSEVKVDVLFADGHTEVWQAEIESAGEITFKDLYKHIYLYLMELRPDENEMESENIIDIQLHLTHSLIGF